MAASADDLRGRPSVADAIASGVVSAGLEIAFAYPGGGSNLAVVDALRRAGARVVLARSEGGATFMAAGVSELTGTPGLVLVGLGPGTANVVNGVAYTFLDRVPMLFLTDAYGPAEAATTTHQLIDQRALLAPVTKWSATLDPAAAPEQIAEALRIALAPPLGPVHLDLSRGVAGAAVSALPVLEQRAVEPVGNAVGGATVVAEASRPLMLVGLEAIASVPQEDLVALAERLRAPVLVTFKAKGVFPERHPLFAGLLTHAAIEAEFVGGADALLGVGLDPVELLPKPWSFPAPVVSLRAVSWLDEYFAPAFSAAGDLGALVRGLSAELPETRSTWTPAEVSAVREGFLGRLRIPAEGSPASWEVVEAVLAEAPDDAIVTVDAGAHMFAATWFVRPSASGRFLMSNGLSTMGYAIPAAVGASLARPGRAVIAFTGDGGALLHGTEARDRRARRRVRPRRRPERLEPEPDPCQAGRSRPAARRRRLRPRRLRRLRRLARRARPCGRLARVPARGDAGGARRSGCHCARRLDLRLRVRRAHAPDPRLARCRHPAPDRGRDRSDEDRIRHRPRPGRPA